jgi:hypothetical protein
MSNLKTLLSGKKIQPRYLHVDWQLELGAIIDQSMWVPYSEFEQQFGDLKLEWVLPIHVQIKVNQETIQQIDIAQTHTFTGSYIVDEATSDLTQHVLEITVTGLDQISEHTWNQKPVAATVNITKLTVQQLPIENVFAIDNTTKITKDCVQQLTIESPVYHWLMQHSGLVLTAMNS